MTQERPIIFAADQVRATLEGRKTQHRVPVRPQPPEWCKDFGYTAFTPKGSISGRGNYENQGPVEKFFKCSIGQPGDRLIVKEIHKIAYDALSSAVMYKADNYIRPGLGDFELHELTCWRSPATMPKWASRITLEIKSVRIERLDEITEADAEAEGARRYDPTAYFTVGQMGRENIPDFEYRAGFAEGWNSLYASKDLGWDVNPWVWIIEFEIVKC